LPFPAVVPGSRAVTLVTGGAGFIGSHLVERLLALGQRVRVVDNLSTGKLENLAAVLSDIEFVRGDLRDEELCRRAVRGTALVFHVAALPSVPRSLEDPWTSHDCNVNATLRLLIACAEARVRRVVYSSSSSAYGDSVALPKLESAEPLPCSPYAAAKLAGEHYVLAFARAGTVEGVALRYFNVFGPRQDPNSPYAAVIPAFLSAAYEGRPVVVFGDGHQTRDFTYVANVVEANVLAAQAPAAAASGTVANVGAGQRTSLLALVDLIREVTGRSVLCSSRPPRPGDVRDSLAGLERAERVLGYRPAVALKDGLKRTWEWFVEAQRAELATAPVVAGA
jgi:UDP-N-acetylglucosamine/UDP-N-acetyl-alpha-D-glucosaminouronate 4-epimerase